MVRRRPKRPKTMRRKKTPSKPYARLQVTLQPPPHNGEIRDLHENVRERRHAARQHEHHRDRRAQDLRNLPALLRLISNAPAAIAIMLTAP
jgi:cytochrome c peroxidase